MRITYLKLENVAGINVGSKRKVLEIDFSMSKNNIVAIQGSNGTGKTVLISSLTPFASVTSLDERSSLSYIIPGKNGYKEIHYQDGNDTYVIKHYYKASKDRHTVKSYFAKNGEELNENGNVTSFLALVEMHLGLTQEMMRLIRIGTNVNSFITLGPAQRKEYIGKLIEEIDMYMQVHKHVNDDIRVVRTLLSTNNQNLYNCHISDVVVEQGKMDSLASDIKSEEKKRDKIVGRIGKIRSMISENNIDDLRRKKQEAESSLMDFDRTERSVVGMGLQNTTVDKLIKQRSDLSETRVDIQARINSYRISIDNTLKNIERLRASIMRITSNNDIQSLGAMVEELQRRVSNVSSVITNFTYLGTPSGDIMGLLAQLNSFNQIAQMIYALGNEPIKVYLGLKFDGKSVDKFLKDQAKKAANSINENDLRTLLNQIFKDDEIISPNCATEYAECPYYRISDTIMGIRDMVQGEIYNGETLRNIQIISNNVDRILNEIDRSVSIHIPDSIRAAFTEAKILERMRARLPFFDITPLQEYLTILKEWELHQQDRAQLEQYSKQLAAYKSSGVDANLKEIEEAEESVRFYRNNIGTLEHDLQENARQLDDIDSKIALVTKYQDSLKYRKMFQSTLDSTNKILGPLETAAHEMSEQEFELRQVTATIDRLRREHKDIEMKLMEYQRLLELGNEYEKKFKNLTIIQEAVSTRKGIPVIYMKSYLGRIQQLANNLLKLIYDDELQLATFKVTEDTFEVPYVKNGTTVPDVKYASQSEVALMTMALSFALANKVSGSYNILLLDEIDAGLDESNRSAFLKMLYMQMSALKAEQAFIISQNLTTMINIPMDVIRLSNAGAKTRLQNVIFE